TPEANVVHLPIVLLQRLQRAIAGGDEAAKPLLPIFRHLLEPRPTLGRPQFHEVIDVLHLLGPDRSRGGGIIQTPAPFARAHRRHALAAHALGPHALRAQAFRAVVGSAFLPGGDDGSIGSIGSIGSYG